VVVRPRHPLAVIDGADDVIFDDHDVNDDWNISWSWVQEMRKEPWPA
jgi:hypothetical protein